MRFFNFVKNIICHMDLGLKNFFFFFFLSLVHDPKLGKRAKKRAKFSDQKSNSTEYQQDNLIYKHIFHINLIGNR